jgi:hypothetical protein
VTGSQGLVATALDNQFALWVVAFLFYGLGDAVTTLLGLRGDGASEAGPVALYALEHGGTPGFLAVKFAFIGVCFLAWYLVDTPGRVAIPLALAVVGVAVTAWNLVVLAT